MLPLTLAEIINEGGSIIGSLAPSEALKMTITVSGYKRRR